MEELGQAREKIHWSRQTIYCDFSINLLFMDSHLNHVPRIFKLNFELLFYYKDAAYGLCYGQCLRTC